MLAHSCAFRSDGLTAFELAGSGRIVTAWPFFPLERTGSGGVGPVPPFFMDLTELPVVMIRVVVVRT
jgi:hypothetical protein